MLKLNDFPSKVTALAAFLLAALAIWVPSGYSYAAVLLLLGALCFAPRWLRQPPESATLKLALLFAGMGCMWFLLSLDHGAARWDKGSKWLLGIPCLFFIVAYPPPPKAFMAGVPLGCIGMGALAVWQTTGQGLERATGFTNAIQWGNLALLLACMAGVCVAVFWRLRAWTWRLLMCAAVVAGIAASLLSQSRGGWLALLLVFPVLLLQVRQIRPQWFGRLLLLSLALVAVVVAVLAFTPSFNERIALAVTEIQSYLSTRNGNTSIGNRLDQYRLVAQMIPEKPWLGWGAHGFVQEMEQRVARGEFAPMLVHYPQIHNDFLDVWVKVGLWGVALQAVLFAYVLSLFWPSQQRLQRWPEDSWHWHEALALRAMGSLVPVCYLVFGMSQPFFNHNSGIMFFVFYVAVLWAALRGLERGARTPSGQSDKPEVVPA
ncbi:MAG: O-antigen ligase family protein [Giesbergeria sp.]|uniref:O-antigen ligase family protein n=1 Tax=Giesbergeria sp. TaxID=2818473 RepID=UPI0026376B16|nr:O-antigen ligase family protein [Giesbergeria sp.]MDD2610938.1 O-antigen ligase family protein [Giesbergeria sp.]